MSKKAGIISVICVILCCVMITGKNADASQVIKGKGNWLFYKAQGDGSTLYDYKGINHYSTLGLKRVVDNLLMAEKAVNSKGCEFVVYIAPNKETIYSEYMPDSYKRKTTYTRCDQLYDYIESNTDIAICYPKEQLLEVKKYDKVYYETDTHWNRVGQFVGVQELLDITDGFKISYHDVKFKKYKNSYRGDLIGLSKGQYNYYVDQQQISTKISKKNKSDKSIFIVGDSFGNRLTNMSNRFYKKARFCHINNFSMSMVKENEIVVWEVVERYQDKLARINFAGR